jgi:hypothetical protein
MAGRRAVAEVVEIGGFDSGRVAASSPFVASPADGRAVRDHVVAIRGDRLDRLQDAGYRDARGNWLRTV